MPQLAKVRSPSGPSIDRETIAHGVDHERRCVFVRLGERAHFRHMVADFHDLIGRDPRIGAYDYVCDLTDFRGDAFVADVGAIAGDYAPHASGAVTYTCFATPDPHFHLWARAMDEMFGGRQHLVFADVEACWSFLERARREA